MFTCLSSEIKSSTLDAVDLVRSAAGYAIIGCHLLAAGGPACGWPGIRANMPTLPRRRSRIQHARCDISPPLHFAPGVECLVQRQAVPQQLVIVRVESRQTDRYRVKPRRLRRELEPSGIGAAHDRRKLRKRRKA